MAPFHFLRYGTAAEQRYMRDYQHTYDGIAINGSMLAHIPKGISAFIYRDVNKKFFVDPMPHSFQHRLDKIQNSSGEIRSSILKLMKIYGDPITLIERLKRPIRNTDFSEDIIPAFVRNVLDFQYNYVKKYRDSEYSPYIEYLEAQNADMDLSKKEPFFLIAPYFYMRDDTYDHWFKLNLQFISESIKQKRSFRNKEIFAELVVNMKLLRDNSRIDKIIDDYSTANGLIYWIDAFDETEADPVELRAVLSFVEKYKSKNPKKLIISLYGGFFSELLLKKGLDGVVHGLEYGESRDVVPVGGGIPLSKYYLPDIKKRIDAATMLRILRLLKINSPAGFHDEICHCKVCRATVRSDVVKDFNRFIKSKPDPVIIKYKKSGNIREIFYPERESKELCLFHYLEMKNIEFKSIKKGGLENETKNLRTAHTKYINYLPEEEISYLKRWAEVFE